MQPAFVLLDGFYEEPIQMTNEMVRLKWSKKVIAHKAIGANSMTSKFV
jgi:hypothetical protein